MKQTVAQRRSFYTAIWRWHFYAGLLCLPLVIWLALTGSLYLWRPQIEGWIDRPHAHLATDRPVASAEAQVAAALGAVPGGHLDKYILPETADGPARVMVMRHGVTERVTIDPRRLSVLKVEREDGRPMRLLFHLHGELLAGSVGSYIVEIAACWTIVMLLTGIYLWWPRGRGGLAGLLYPRLRGGGRLFWRDLHASTGLWVSLLALGLVLTGLPWAKSWGNYLRVVREATGTARGPVDWSIGGKLPEAPSGDHAGHQPMAMPAMTMHPPGELDRVVAAVVPLGIATPVVVTPPKAMGGAWKVASDAANRPLRSEATIEGASGRVLSQTPFARRHWIDRTIGYGVAAHEGALFGLANQILGTLTALALVLLSVSGAVMWWKRRPAGLLGAPVPQGAPRLGWGLIAAVAALAIYMPLFGLSLVVVQLAERVVLRRHARSAAWLGLAPPVSPRSA